MYKEGQILNDTSEHVVFAIWNNTNGGKFYSESNNDGTYTIHEVPIIEPTIEEQNERIRLTRADLYARLIDPLHLQKIKDTIMNEWDDEKEQAYISKVKELTLKIREENPYK